MNNEKHKPVVRVISLAIAVLMGLTMFSGLLMQIVFGF